MKGVGTATIGGGLILEVEERRDEGREKGVERKTDDDERGEAVWGGSPIGVVRKGRRGGR